LTAALDSIKRKLPSLQKQIEDYSRKVWYTIPSAHTPPGIDPNAPREPGFLGTNVRLAARVVDELVGGNPANLGECDCPSCGCELRHVDGSYQPCEHDLACSHFGESEDAEVVSARLRSFVSEFPSLAKALGRGVDAVYELAGLTPAETQVARYKHEGLSHRSIAFLTNRKEGTVFALYSRSTYKLEQLALELEAAA
jgi:hypothetical protein